MHLKFTASSSEKHHGIGPTVIQDQVIMQIGGVLPRNP